MKFPKQIFMLSAVLLATSVSSQAQIPYSAENSRLFDKSGKPVTLDQIIDAAKDTDVVFLGESHDDAAGHALQAEIFKRIVEKYGTERKIALSMEMFERDTQVVVNEYLNGLIPEKHFLASSRPWGNYATDYKPLVELAKEKKLPVIAANAPRRYVNMVSRGGRASLDTLTPEAKGWLAPLPYAQASPVYATKFNALMGNMPEARGGLSNVLDSQSLWDATMGHSIAEFLKANKNGLVVQLNGRFHSEKRLGTVEHLLKYQPGARVVVVSMQYDPSFPNFNKATQENLGDFVVLTDPKLPRSQR